MNGSCGPTYSMWWDDCVLDGFVLRTRQGLLPGFPPSSIDLPKWGTWDRGGWWPRATWEPATNGNGTSYLPTPVAHDSGNRSENHHLAKKNRADGGNRTSVTSLQIVVTQCLLPTPTAWRQSESAESFAQRKLDHGITGGVSSLDVVVEHCLLLTPQATDEWVPATTSENTLHRGDPTSARRNTSGSLTKEVARLLPTPSVADSTGGHTSRSGDRIDEPLLGGVARLLPTPTAAHGRRFDGDGNVYGDAHTGLSLENWALLPTPTTADGFGGPGGHRGGGPNLRTEVVHWVLPTPVARDGDMRAGGGNRAARRMMAHETGPNLPEVLNWVANNPSSPACPTAPAGTTGPPYDDMRLF
jgi:hypothetical protein